MRTTPEMLEWWRDLAEAAGYDRERGLSKFVISLIEREAERLGIKKPP